MPALGLGVFKCLPGKSTYKAVVCALRDSRYRHIDTAALYENEADVGRGLRDSGLGRTDVFLTTKLWHDSHGNAMKACRDSLARMRVEFVDLYLIHSPLSRNRIKVRI